MKKLLNKRVLAVMLALVMVFSMSTFAFANTDSTITVTVEFYNLSDYGTQVAEAHTVSIDTEDFERVYDIPSNVSSDVITDANTPTVMDAVVEALNLSSSAVGWDMPTNSTNYIGGYLSSILGLSTQTAADSSSTVWRGYAWQYYLDYYTNYEENPVELYATNVELEDGMVITWTYNYREEPIS